MAMDFPNSPTVGQIFTSNGTSWEWDGTVWKIPTVNEIASNGLVAKTGDGALAARTITAGTGITISNGDGVSGNPTISATGGTGTVTNVATNNGITGGPITTTGTVGLTGQALALHNLSTSGMIARTGAGTVAGRTLTAGTGISITNGDGVSGNPTISATGGGGTGTVTSVATANGITGGPITTTGTVELTGQALAVHNLSTSGLITRTGAGTVAGRTLTAGTGTAVTNGDGVSGNPSVALTGQALALHNLATNGIIARTGTGTVAGRTLTAGTGISISNGDGVSGNPTISATGGGGTVTSVGSGTGLTGGPITTTGTLALTGQALAVHNLATNGLVTRTSAGNVAGRTITAGTGISVSNGDGVGGNPVITSLVTGTVTSIATNNGITGGTITTTGTVGLTGQALALHNLATSGLIARTGAGTVAGRTITAGTGITVTNGDGISGNPTITATNTGTVTSIATGNGITGGTITSTGTLGLTGQALALHNLATSGIIARTGAGTVSARTITAGSNVSITNGDGVSGNPTISAIGFKPIFTGASGVYFPYYNAALENAILFGAYVYATPVLIDRSISVDRISFLTQFSGTGDVRLGIYDSSNGLPNSRVLDAGTVNVPSTTTAAFEITISQSLSAGLYFLAITSNSNVGGVVSYANGNGMLCASAQAGMSTDDKGSCIRTSATHSGNLPSTFGAAVSDNRIFVVRLRVV
jgi:hypothetical protein